MYNPDEIRTSNMLPDRSSDVFFQEDPEPGHPDASKTQQQFQKECDVNFIVHQNEATGLVTHLNRGTPAWGVDLSDAPTYQEALNLVMDAQASFASLDARVRARFENDPVKLLAFLDNPDNLQEAISLGLVEPKPSPSAPAEKPTPTPSE